MLEALHSFLVVPANHFALYFAIIQENKGRKKCYLNNKSFFVYYSLFSRDGSPGQEPHRRGSGWAAGGHGGREYLHHPGSDGCRETPGNRRV